jgi:hypothetical protein
MTAQVSARPYDVLLSNTRDRLLGDAWFYYAVFFYTAFGLVFVYLLGGTGETAHAAYAEPLFKVFGLFMPVIALGFDAIRVIVRLDHRRPLAFRMVFSSERMASMMAGMIMMAGIALFMGTFTTIKISLPLLFDGFPHDRLHADIDRMLHFGVDPWRWLHGVASSEIVRSMLEFNYGTIWFILCFGGVFFVATSPKADTIRIRYLVMFMVCWMVVGNVLAGAFLSAGPAFYGEVTGDHGRFADLLALLSQNPDTASPYGYQRYLWALYQNDIKAFGAGISAFPSVHVALITMNALFVAERSRLLGGLAFVYVALIVLSSVYLGWHYAIDGYISIALVVSGHFLVRRIFRTGDAADAGRHVLAKGG